MKSRPRPHLWTIVLAGGDGIRLRPLTRALHGEDYPKQFAFIQGNRSLLQATVARARRWSSPEHIVVVVAEEREALARAQLEAFGPIQIVPQPSNRGTGPGLLLPLSRVLAFDPAAHVVVLPSDHYVRDEEPFERSVREAVEHSALEITLVGAIPDRAETQYGWIIRSGGQEAGGDRVDCFCEKPPATVAEQLMRDGGLWNTFVMAGTIQHFWALAGQHLPLQAARFSAYLDSVGTPEESLALQTAYAHMPAADFSRDVLERAPELRVVPLQACGWSDWGTPERVLDSLRDQAEYAPLSERLALALAS